MRSITSAFFFGCSSSSSSSESIVSGSEARCLPLAGAGGGRAAEAEREGAAEAGADGPFGKAVPCWSSDDRQVPSGSTVTDSTDEGHTLRMLSKYLLPGVSTSVGEGDWEERRTRRR